MNDFAGSLLLKATPSNQASLLKVAPLNMATPPNVAR
jgi:hypothetical protein